MKKILEKMWGVVTVGFIHGLLFKSLTEVEDDIETRRKKNFAERQERHDVFLDKIKKMNKEQFTISDVAKYLNIETWEARGRMVSMEKDGILTYSIEEDKDGVERKFYRIR